MIIKILQDNTVHVRYSDGSEQTLNSTHSHKAASPIVKAVCDALPYKGAMEFLPDVDAPVFTFDSLECTNDCPDFEAAIEPFLPELTTLKAELDGEQDSPVMETIEEEVEEVEVVDGKAVIKKVKKSKQVQAYDEVPCVDENGDGICDIIEHKHIDEEGHECVEQEEVPRMFKVPKIKKGVPATQETKDRLKELICCP
jgi:hypothetical protein